MKKITRRLVVFLGLCLVVGFFNQEALEDLIPSMHQKNIDQMALMYCAQPSFSSKGLLGQLTHSSAKLQAYDLDEQRVYFSLPDMVAHNPHELVKLTVHPENVEFANKKDGARHLGEYRLYLEDSELIRFPARDFRVDPKATVQVKFDGITYDLTLEELYSYSTDRSIYGGQVTFGTRTYNTVCANFGRYVSRRGEPSMKRLVARVLSGEQKKEVQAQRLLEFVNTWIKYDPDEADGSVQMLRRANEAFMCRWSVCAGLTTAYSSCLEQTDIDYVIVYLPGHVTVMVEGDYGQGAFYQATIQCKRYTLAEPTCRGFVIGQTRLENDFQVKNIEYFQRPSRGGVIDALTEERRDIPTFQGSLNSGPMQ